MGRPEVPHGAFVFALMEATLPEILGFVLAKTAANENIPVLLFSGRADAIEKLKRLGFSCLEKPLSLETLLLESRRLIAKSGENVLRVKASALLMQARRQALETAIATSNRLLEQLRASAPH